MERAIKLQEHKSLRNIWTVLIYVCLSLYRSTFTLMLEGCKYWFSCTLSFHATSLFCAGWPDACFGSEGSTHMSRHHRLWRKWFRVCITRPRQWQFHIPHNNYNLLEAELECSSKMLSTKLTAHLPLRCHLEVKGQDIFEFKKLITSIDAFMCLL